MGTSGSTPDRANEEAKGSDFVYQCQSCMVQESDGLCKQCNIQLCQICFISHQVQPGNSDHTIEEATGIKKQPREILCTKNEVVNPMKAEETGDKAEHVFNEIKTAFERKAKSGEENESIERENPGRSLQVRFGNVLDEKSESIEDQISKRDPVNLCPKHTNELIKYYCPNHENLGCKVCVTTEHQECKSLEYVPCKCAIEQTLKDFNHSVTNLQEKAEEVKKKASENSKTAKEIYVESKTAIETYQTEIMTAEKKLDNLKKEAEKLMGKDEDSMKKIQEQSCKVSDNAKQLAKILTEHKSDDHWSQFIAIKKAEQELKKLDDNLAIMDVRNEIHHYTFMPNLILKQFLKSSSPPGTFTAGKLIDTDQPILAIKDTKDEMLISKVDSQKGGQETARNEILTNQTGADLSEINDSQENKQVSFKKNLQEGKDKICGKLPKKKTSSKKKTTTQEKTKCCNEIHASEIETISDETAKKDGEMSSIEINNENSEPCLEQRQSNEQKEVSKGKPIHVKSIAVDLPTDKQSNWITGLVKVSGKLVVTDNGNHSVKVFTISTGKFQAEMRMPSQPWDIAKISNKQVAVTMPANRFIAFIRFGKEWTVNKICEMDGECYGIAHKNGKLAVAFGWANIIQTLDIEGNLLNQITLDLNCAGILARTFSLSFSTEMLLYVANSSNSKLLCISLETGKIWMNEDETINNPRKVIAGDDGNIFICGRNSNSIYLKKPRQESFQVVLTESDGVKLPHALDWCSKSKQLFVGMWDNNKVEVFQF